MIQDTENSEENPNHCDFTSTNVYKGECAYSRRDDLESLAYLMIYMLRGELPWTVMWNSAKDTPKYRNLTQSQFVQSIKMKTKPEALTQGLPSVFCQFVKDLKKLGYDEKPQYEVCVVYLYPTSTLHRAFVVGECGGVSSKRRCGDGCRRPRS
jgi:hypothetical protein